MEPNSNLNWQKPSACGSDSNQCVESAFRADGSIGLRNSTKPGDVVWFTPQEWELFAQDIIAGKVAPQA